jgi:hypothetical protein
VLVQCSVAAGRKCMRARTRFALQSFLNRLVIHGSDDSQFSLDQVEYQCRDKCMIQSSEDGCKCAVSVLTEIAAQPDRRLSFLVCSAVCSLAGRTGCLACMAWLNSIITSIKEIALEHGAERFHVDFGKLTHFHCGPDTSTAKKRRTDADFVEFIATTAILDGRSNSSNSLAVAIGDHGRQSGIDFSERDLAMYVASLALSASLQESGVTLSIIDGARLGNPARDYLVHAGVLSSNFGVWFPPRVPG